MNSSTIANTATQLSDEEKRFTYYKRIKVLGDLSDRIKLKLTVSGETFTFYLFKEADVHTFIKEGITGLCIKSATKLVDLEEKLRKEVTCIK